MVENYEDLVEENKGAIAEIYKQDLAELRTGEIPFNFETHADIFRETLHTYSFPGRQTLLNAYEAGNNQYKFLRAIKTVKSFKEDEASRITAIDALLND